MTYSKQNLMALLAFFVFHVTQAQITTNEVTIENTTKTEITGDLEVTGSLGIGTTNPGAKLHVFNGNNSYGAILANSSETAFSLYTKSLDRVPDTETFRLGLKYNDDERNGFISFYRGNSFDGGFLGFSTHGVERVRISRNGNVGIGTTGPSAKLQVNGVTADGEISKNAINSFITTNTNSNVTSYDKGAFVHAGYYSIAQGVKDSGYKIAVDASAYANTTSFKGTLRRNYGIWARAGIYRGTSGAKIENAVAVEAQILDNVEGTSIDNVYGVRISTNDFNKSSVINRYDLYAGTSTAKNYFAGNVGIGTSSPQQKLHVNGSIKTAQNTWSDFVFDDDYTLPTLEEVEEQIKKHKHLPDIPSEKQIIEEGYVLGDMDAKLLQKIEELTLYVIDLNKRVNELETENTKLKASLKN